MYEVTATQKGAIGESIVAIQLILESGGRLSPFEPLADDDGIDLLIYDKETGHSAPLQVKTRTGTVKRNPNIVHFQVRRATFDSNVDGFVLGVLLDPEGTGVVRAWLIPMKDLPGLAGSNERSLVIRPSMKLDSEDKFMPYRYEGIGGVARRMCEHFDRYPPERH